jgi:hypothetical protein
MNTASLDLIMAGNEQYRQNAFQAAESGIEHAVIFGSFNPGVATEGPETHTVTDDRQTDDVHDTYTTTITAQLGGLKQGAIWGNSWNSFATYHFEIVSTGTSIRNATATHTQGVAVLAPYDNTVPPDPNVPSTALE